MLTKKINWGIIGLGHIANKFAHDLLLTKNAELCAVASRDLLKAKSFHLKYQAKKFYSNYEELVQDPEIDIVYIATPHVFHFEHSMLCLDNNKAVLCEKPFAINSHEVHKMVETAKSRNLFLMEAMWTRFIPGIQKVIDLVQSGVIGKIEKIEANFGYVADILPQGRLFNKALGGGSLMDIGIYPIYLSQLLLGKPSEIKANAEFINTVDSSCEIEFRYKNGQTTKLKSTLTEDTSTEAIINGSKGKIKIHSRFHHPKLITVSNNTGLPENIEVAYIGNGYYHEILEANNCLLSHKISSKKMSYTQSIELINTLDKIRKIIGLLYPNDLNY